MGKLVLCATPIGNLEDITYRAVNVLMEADIIAAEDTRHTKKLLSHYNIRTTLTSYHEHNKMEKGLLLIKCLKEGQTVALVTDAGTPGISDPGEDLVKMALKEGITVTATPGPVAAIMALIISGQSTRRFVFEGFLPTDKREKQFVLNSLKNEVRTIILYEAPHRLLKTLDILKEVLGNRNITITKELTKKYESVFNATIEEAIGHYKYNDPRGEYVLVIEGRTINQIKEEEQQAWEDMSIEEHMDIYEKQGYPQKDAMKLVAKDRGISKREVYSHIHKNNNM